jgi:hypothetical protein
VTIQDRLQHSAAQIAATEAGEKRFMQKLMRQIAFTALLAVGCLLSLKWPASAQQIAALSYLQFRIQPPAFGGRWRGICFPAALAAHQPPLTKIAARRLY